MTGLGILAASITRASVVALLIGFTLTALRVRRAHLRLLTWTVVLYAALAMPVLVTALPHLSVPLPMLNRAAATTPSAAGSAEVNAPLAAEHDGAILSPTRLSRVLATLYVCGVVTLLARAVVGSRLSRRLVRTGRVIDDEHLIARAKAHACRLGCAAPPRLLESSETRVPVTTGVWHPTVIVPETWRAWPVSTVDAVLAHETSHVARRDALTLRLSLLYRALTWLSPLSWWLHQRLATLAEHVSDEAVLDAGIDRTTYAEALLGFLAASHRPSAGPSAWHVAMARGAGANAERRLERILTWTGDRPMTRSSLVALVLFLLVAPTAALTASVELRRVDIAAPDVPTVLTASIPAARPVASIATATIAPRQRALPPPPQIYSDDTPGLTVPTPVRRVEARYTPEAMRAKIQGTVEVSIVVGTDGAVEDAKIVRSLDASYGLDIEAVKAARQWTFTPGVLDGKAVKVRTTITIEFRLH